MSVNVRKGKVYTDLNHDWLTKGWDVSAVSFHKLLQVLYNKDAMNEWGSIVALSYVAAQRVFPNYNDMADNKAYLESVARSFGYFFGKNKKLGLIQLVNLQHLQQQEKVLKDLMDLSLTRKKCLHLEMQMQMNAQIILLLYSLILQKK